MAPSPLVVVFVSSPWEDDCVALSFLSLPLPSLFCGVLGFPRLTPWLPLPGNSGTGAAPDARGRQWIFLQALGWKTSERARARAEPGALEKRLGFLSRPVICLAF